MRGLPFRGFGVFANVLTAAGLLLMALGSPAEKTLHAAIAPTTSAAGGNER
jgi:hypothetical protein